MNNESLKELYPKLTEEELQATAENLDRYLTLAWEIYEDLHTVNPGALTTENLNPSVNERSIPQTN